MQNFRGAELSEADRAMLEFAEALTLHPGSMREANLEALRQVGFTDCAIHDIVQVTALFAYYNRIADGLGIEHEQEWPPYDTQPQPDGPSHSPAQAHNHEDDQ